MPDDRQVLLDLEKQRCDALAKGDVDTLRSMLSDDYVHIHLSGLIDDRDGHLKVVAARPRVPVRGDILIRFYGDVAVMTGDLDNHMGAPNHEIVRASCQQVAVKGDGKWQFVSIQLTQKR